MRQKETNMTNIASASFTHLETMNVLTSTLPNDLFQEITGDIADLSKDSEPYNDRLIGHIQEEYSLDHSIEKVSSFVIALANAWTESNPGHLNGMQDNQEEFYIEGMWVNKQRKYEFNPIHNHSGDLSFVIWMKIPYNLADEENYFPLVPKTLSSYTSKFCFVHTDALGRITQFPVPVDKSFEGTIVIFPSQLHHTVYPFYTSDDYRISISGNIKRKDVI